MSILLHAELIRIILYGALFNLVKCKKVKSVASAFVYIYLRPAK